ncbi:hypothetical protein Cali_184 [Mycobacterium phage Cali]|uniref:Uncharacterized protein n=30 Tax=Bixzunavirus TaxID=680114 RepID=Q853C2_BPMBZ|nr:gp181 [Mycobacterium phage Bxz1]YP_002224628.1 gp184 [Mycobacterium phage Cali]YP_002224849.1 gp184 [Mycobacterium phage Rizal]YP_008060961.1 hypothetical protein M181_gp166 [Mycobacterium phage Gizmo]YP_008061418.1 hypothetical protein M180_gp162 [Mycobacterium phage ArcherS7]YP_008061650.1 hypothetical protein M182_gp160 [Mycobacterium phage Astraea]YP_009012942.1 hypothetical protein DANDELION_197 [Mycobacterium phage Dandelion]YP_009016621.1 hypothetical protein NAPPY_190 [Mycobacteri
MRVKNEDLWTQELSLMDRDEATRKFRDFLVKWGELAEEGIKSLPEEGAQAGPYFFAEAVSKALPVAEQTMGGYVSVEWIGQMLLYFTQHAVWGEDMYEGLPYIVQRLVDQAAAVAISQMQEEAECDSADSQTGGANIPVDE